MSGWDWDYAAPEPPAAKAPVGEHPKCEQFKEHKREISSIGEHPAPAPPAPPAPAPAPAPPAPALPAPDALRLRRGQRAACPCTGDVLAVERGGIQPLLRAQDGALHVCPAATLARAAAGRPRHGSGSVQVALSVSREELARWRERPDVRALGFSAAVRNVLERAS